MKLGTKKAGKAIMGTVKKVGAALGDAGEAVIDAPAKLAGRAVDEAVDSLKDDQFIVDGESRFILFGVEVGRITHLLRAYAANKD